MVYVWGLCSTKQRVRGMERKEKPDKVGFLKVSVAQWRESWSANPKPMGSIPIRAK